MGLKLEEVARDAAEKSRNSRLILLIGNSKLIDFISKYLDLGGLYNMIKFDPREEYHLDSEKEYIIYLDKCFGNSNNSGSNSSSQAA